MNGIWYQPLGSFQKWKDRGITTLIGYEAEGGTVTLDVWCKGATAMGLSYVLDDNLPPAAWSNASCVGVLLTPDEPNGAGTRTPGQMLDAAVRVRQLTMKSIMMTLDGWKLQYMTDALVAAYAQIADVLMPDWYLCNHGDGITALPEWSKQWARLVRLSQGRQVVPFIECCDQKVYLQDWAGNIDPDGQPRRTKMHPPKISEVVSQVSAARGVSGNIGRSVVWFPDIIGKGWEAFDGVTPEMAGAMTVLNAF